MLYPKTLPQVPPHNYFRDSAPDIAKIAAQRRMQVTGPQVKPDVQCRMDEMDSLYEKNWFLNRELEYIHQLQSAHRQFLEQIKEILRDLQGALLRWHSF